MELQTPASEFHSTGHMPCSEMCGANHRFIPILFERLPHGSVASGTQTLDMRAPLLQLSISPRSTVSQLPSNAPALFVFSGPSFHQYRFSFRREINNGSLTKQLIRCYQTCLFLLHPVLQILTLILTSEITFGEICIVWRCVCLTVNDTLLDNYILQRLIILFTVADLKIQYCLRILITTTRLKVCDLSIHQDQPISPRTPNGLSRTCLIPKLIRL